MCALHVFTFFSILPCDNNKKIHLPEIGRFWLVNFQIHFVLIGYIFRRETAKQTNHEPTRVFENKFSPSLASFASHRERQTYSTPPKRRLWFVSERIACEHPRSCLPLLTDHYWFSMCFLVWKLFCFNLLGLPSATTLVFPQNDAWN